MTAPASRPPLTPESADQAPPAGGPMSAAPTHGRWGPRRRWWLAAGTAVLLTLAYLVAWGTYASLHVPGALHYEILDPGATARTPTADLRLVSLTSTPLLANQKYGGEPESAVPGAVWAVAELEVTTHRAGLDAYCDVSLLGPDKIRWPQESTVSGRTLPSYCGDDSIQPERPARIEVVFQVPDRYANQVFGVVVTSVAPGTRDLVLRPS